MDQFDVEVARIHRRELMKKLLKDGLFLGIAAVVLLALLKFGG